MSEYLIQMSKRTRDGIIRNIHSKIESQGFATMLDYATLRDLGDPMADELYANTLETIEKFGFIRGFEK